MKYCAAIFPLAKQTDALFIKNRLITDFAMPLEIKPPSTFMQYGFRFNMFKSIKNNGMGTVLKGYSYIIAFVYYDFIAV